ncbi:MAG: GWxTD domain-containing protein [Bacteroidetes bacterium]|nr:GWxTD domain-containing protein [Bacteroidota bacterium]
MTSMYLQRTLAVCIVLNILVSYSNVAAQTMKQLGTMQVFVDMLCFESDVQGHTSANIYVQIPYSEVTFVKTGEQYTANVDIVITIEDSTPRPWSTSKRITIEAEDFSQTVSPRRTVVQQFTTDIKPGEYTMVITVTDVEPKKSVKLDRKIHIPDFTTMPVSMSNIMLVQRASTDEGRVNVVPNFSGKYLQGEGPLIIFFEIYTSLNIDSLMLVATLMTDKEKEVARFTRIQAIDGHRTQVLWSLDGSSLSVSRAKVKVDLIGCGIDSLRIPRVSTSRSFTVHMRGLPLTVTDITKAIEQLRYIARDNELDEMRNAPTEEEKRRLFFEFWKRRDPDPSTPRNELMEEYYDRVAYANHNFTRFMEGWMTDMGMVYIQFGPPDNIERHPFESDSKPYEIWYYYKLNREFVFVDETGFGDYRLQYPLRDLWGRIR